MAVRGEYAGRGRPEEAERERLEHLSARLNPGTQSRMRALGIGRGWRCLEVGAAEGSMSRWMAERVASGGQVVAADIDLRFLTECAGPGVEVRRFDLRSDRLEDGHYDLAYCRTLLLHLPDPAAALAKMVTALRPGGWLLVQEPDVGATSAADLDHPHAATFAELTHRIYGWLRAHGVFDPYFGRTLPRLLATLDLVDVASEAASSIVRGGGPETALYQQTLTAMTPMLTAKGVVTEHELAQLHGIYEDPSFDQLPDLQFRAWGRRGRSLPFE